MKKIFSTMAVAAALFAGYSTYNTQQNTELTGIALANVEALAEGIEKNTCTGGVANVRCPIWDITYSATWTGPEITCITGGSWKCEEGTCPHGK